MIKNFRIELILLSIILINIFFSQSADLIFANFFQNIGQYLGEGNCKYCSSDYIKNFFIGITELGDSLWYFIISVLLVTFCLIINKTKILKSYKNYVDAVFFSSVFLFVALIITGFVGLSTILASIILPISTALYYKGGVATTFGIFTIVIAIFIIFTHRRNIIRMMDGNESRFEKAMIFRKKT